MAMHGAEWIPRPLVIVLDCALLPVLCATLAATVVSARKRLFWWTLPPLVAFAAANIAFHVALARGSEADAQWALMLGVHALAFLFTLYGGLFIPAFTRRWLRERGERARQVALEDMRLGRFELMGTGATLQEYLSVVGFEEWTRSEGGYPAAKVGSD